MRWKRIVLIVAAVFATGFIASAALMIADVRIRFAGRVFTLEKAPKTNYAVVLGASVGKNGDVSRLLSDRLDTAIILLKNKKIMKIVITGDDGAYASDEISAMKKYLSERGVPDDLIYADAGAYRTADSCKHIKQVGLQNVAFITQQFHLPRALYLCNKLGVDSFGVVADTGWYWNTTYYWMRDFVASLFAFLDARGITIIQKGPRI